MIHRVLPLLFLVAACGVPSPPPHGPVPPPPPVALSPDAVLSDVRATYPAAKLEGAPESESFGLVFGAGPPVTNAEAFASALFERHAVHLAAGTLGRPFGNEAGDRVTRGVFASPPRDTGCRRVRLELELVARVPLRLARTCERFEHPPPSYRGRALPSTATGSVDILVRVGSVGGIAGLPFSGFAIDRYGDVYTASDARTGPPGSEPEPFLRDYVRTLSPAEVEQFAFDVALALGEPAPSEAAPPVADADGLLIEVFVTRHGAVEGVDLERTRGNASTRALGWARSVAH